jgi:hypothetical protein
MIYICCVARPQIGKTKVLLMRDEAKSLEEIRWQTDPARNGRIVIPAYTYVGSVPPTTSCQALTECSDDGGVPGSTAT